MFWMSKVTSSDHYLPTQAGPVYLFTFDSTPTTSYFFAEQEDLITALRDESLAANRRFLLVLQVTVGLSCLL